MPNQNTEQNLGELYALGPPIPYTVLVAQQQTEQVESNQGMDDFLGFVTVSNQGAGNSFLVAQPRCRTGSM